MLSKLIYILYYYIFFSLNYKFLWVAVRGWWARWEKEEEGTEREDKRETNSGEAKGRASADDRVLRCHHHHYHHNRNAAPWSWEEEHDGEDQGKASRWPPQQQPQPLNKAYLCIHIGPLNCVKCPWAVKERASVLLRVLWCDVMCCMSLNFFFFKLNCRTWFVEQRMSPWIDCCKIQYWGWICMECFMKLIDI